MMLIVVAGVVYLILTGLALWEIVHADDLTDVDFTDVGDDNAPL